MRTAAAYPGWVRAGWVRELERAGFRPLGVDLPGHGTRAGPVPPGTTRAGLVDRVAGLVAGLGTGRPVPLVGYSVGAQLAWSAAARCPGIGPLVLGGLGPRDRLAELGRALREDAAQDPAVHELAAALALTAEGPRQVGRWAAFARLVGAEPFDPRAGVPTQPALLFAGGRDPWADPGELARLRPAGVATELLRVPGRDHVDVLTARPARAGAAAFLRRSGAPCGPGVFP